MQLSTIREVAVLRHQENSSTLMWSGQLCMNFSYPGNGARGKPNRRHPFPAPSTPFHRTWLFHRENGDQGETRPRQKESAIPSCKNRRMKSFWGRHMSAGRTSSQSCNITNHMKNMNKLHDMKFYIRKINAEREELFRILDIDMNTDLNYRMNIEFTIIKSQHEKTMLDMEKMTQSISDTIEKYKEFIEDKDSYSFTHTHLLKECNQLKEKVRMLLNENRKLLVEQADQEASYGEEKRFCDETSKNIHPKC